MEKRELEHICAWLFDIAADLYNKVGDSPEVYRIYKAVDKAANLLDEALNNPV